MDRPIGWNGTNGNLSEFALGFERRNDPPTHRCPRLTRSQRRRVVTPVAVGSGLNESGMCRKLFGLTLFLTKKPTRRARMLCRSGIREHYRMHPAAKGGILMGK